MYFFKMSVDQAMLWLNASLLQFDQITPVVTFPPLTDN